jgi:hypothetical protein
MDFGVRIEEAIGACDLFIALIGDDWLDIADAGGRRRLDDPDDPVRLEIGLALARSDLVVIPVLVEGATMPRAEQLPDDLKPLTRRNAHVLTDARWRSNVDELIQVAQSVLPVRSEEPPHHTEQTEQGPGRAAGDVVGPTARPTHLRWLLGLGVRLQPGRLATTIVAVGVVAMMAMGLILGLLPALEPDESPAAKGAKLSNETLDRISFGQYLDRISVSRAGYRAAKLEQPGALVGLHLEVTGYKGKRLPLHWRLIDARTGGQVDRSRDLSYIPEATNDQNSWSIWIPVPSGRDRRFFVEVELLDDRGAVPVPLGRVRTARFGGAPERPEGS